MCQAGIADAGLMPPGQRLADRVGMKQLRLALKRAFSAESAFTQTEIKARKTAIPGVDNAFWTSGHTVATACTVLGKRGRVKQPRWTNLGAREPTSK